ncbi:hypothetical protein ACN2WE_05505 [Streptomyces sp. cg28]|uniref:hypothetical protein n=1 Tax=Streptomyces sp. cg28 TaxID=3403457 RepID=UPI003B2255F2
MSTRDLERLATAVKTARLDRYPSRVAAAEAAGVSKGTWQRIEEAKEVRDGSYAKVEKALDWPPGTCDRILAGEAAPTALDVDVTVRTPDEMDESVRDIVQLAAIATTPGLTGAEIRALSDRITEDLRRAGKI